MADSKYAALRNRDVDVGMGVIPIDDGKKDPPVPFYLLISVFKASCYELSRGISI